MSSLPIISSNTDAVLRHQAKFITSSTDIVLTENADKRKIILSLITTGASVGIGPGGSSDLSFGLGDTSETNFIGVLPNVPVLINTVIVKVDGAEQGTDDGAGNITGAGISTGTVDYATGDIDVTFSSPPGLDEVVSATYTGFDTNSYINIVGAAPFDLSGFLKNSPYALYNSNKGLIISPEAGEETAIAFIEIKDAG